MVAASQEVQSSGEPAWDIARIFPNQGEWSVEDYLLLPGNHLVELFNGKVEVLPMPTQMHQNIVAFLYEAILLFARPRDLGKVLFAPLRVRLSPTQMREPHIAFMLKANEARRHNEYWDGADWVIEVISEDNPKCDLEIKRVQYALAGIPEYWIIDPVKEEVLVLGLEGETYIERGIFKAGDHAPSSVVKGFNLDVAAMFAEARN